MSVWMNVLSWTHFCSAFALELHLCDCPFLPVGSFLPGSPPTAVSPCQPPCQTPQLSGSGHDCPSIYTWDWPLPRTSKCHCTVLSLIWLLATLWTEACQAPRPVGFSRQEYWSGLPFPPQGVFPTQGSNPCLLQLLYQQADSLPTWEGHPQCPWPFLISKWSRKCPLL